MLTFDRLSIGQVGSVELATAPALDLYRRIHPSLLPSDVLPPGLLVALLMRGYLAAMPNRPPGNVHAGQALKWGAPAPVDTIIIASISCMEKEQRKGRRWVRFEVELRSALSTHLTAINTSIWGA